MVTKKNLLVFWLLAGFCLLIASVAPFVLPARFFFDAYTITKGNIKPGLIGSYEFTTLFYKVTKLGSLPFVVVSLIQYPILIWILYKIGVPKNFYVLNAKNALVYLSIVMLAVFMAMPTKEFITFLFITVIVFILQKGRFTKFTAVLIMSLLFIGFGAFFRPYFAMIPILAIGMYFISRIKLEKRNAISVTYGVLIVIFMSLSYGLVKGKYFSESTREDLNDTRLNAAASNSIILPPAESGTWYGESINIVHGFFSVNFPVNGFKHIFSPQILAFVVWQLFLFWILMVRLGRNLKSPQNDYYGLWALLFLFSYFIVQGVFEPDLGSAIRHKIGMLPLIYFALYYEHFRKEPQQDI